MVVEYSTQQLNVTPINNSNKILATGKGVLHGAPKDSLRDWSYIPIDVSEYPVGTNLKITVSLGLSKSSGSYNLYGGDPSKLNSNERPLVGAYDRRPGSVTVLSYKTLINGPKIFYLEII